MGKQTKSISMYFLIPLFALLIFYTNSFAIAQTDDTEFDVTEITGDEIKTSLVAQQMLERIELSKKILEELREGKSVAQTEQTQQQKLIEEQRKISQQKLQEQIDRMNKKYEPFTPRNAFSSFLSGVNEDYHGIYWDQFNYMDEKVKIARAAQQSIINQGGTYHEALQEYVKYASMTRVEMVKYNQELNIKYGFADTNVQKVFNKIGKIPRTFDESLTNGNISLVIDNGQSISEKITDNIESDRVYNVSHEKYKKKCEKLNAKALKFLSMEKELLPRMVMKLYSCGYDIPKSF